MEYASLLPVPLTTLRQPTREIGAAAFAATLDRVRRPETPSGRPSPNAIWLCDDPVAPLSRAPQNMHGLLNDQRTSSQNWLSSSPRSSAIQLVEKAS